MLSKKTAVLIANLGSPSAPTTSAVRQFLREFLSDPRVVNIPSPLWRLILHLFILPFRPSKSLKAYKKIWQEKGSPLVFLTRQLGEKIAGKLDGETVVTDYAMRYGQPSIASRLRRFQELGVTHLLVLPLYPQYSSTTTASIYDGVVKELNRWRHLPHLQFISDYFQHSAYLAAIAESIKLAWQRQGGKNQLLLMSFHGLPARLTQLGDPYFLHCQKTAELVAQRLQLQDNEWKLVFQSRFGKAEWLKPYCADTLKKLPALGIKRIDVVCPGFAVDCLETLEEIAMENKAVFIGAGGEAYHYIPALNDSDAHVELMLTLLAEKL